MWPSEADEVHYALVRGFDVPVEYLGGEPVTALQRVVLDLFNQVDLSIGEYRSVLPPRYARDDMGAHRLTGSIDALLSVFEYLSGRPSDDAVRLVVELLRERGRPDQVQVLEQWVADNPPQAARSVLELRTLTATESAALARLDGLLDGPVVSAPAARVPSPALGAPAVMTRLAGTLCEPGQHLSVSESGVAVIDEAGDEVSVFEVSELPEPFASQFADAYARLMPERGVAFTVEPRAVSLGGPSRSVSGRSRGV